MLNQTTWWKYLLIALVLAVGSFYALPNIFGNDPGVQIRGARGLGVDRTILARVEGVLAGAEVEAKSILRDADGIKIRFHDSEGQLKARDAIEEELGNGYTTALTLLSGAPAWLTDAGANPMYLGLDLRGGVHFLLEVDMDNAIARARERYAGDLKSLLREDKLRYRSVRPNPAGDIEITLRDEAQMEQARTLVEQRLPELQTKPDERRAGVLVVQMGDEQVDEIKEFALEQNMTALRNRIDQLGVAEPVVQRQGDDRLVIQLPGVQDTARAKRILGRAATLEMRMVDEEHNDEAIESGQAPPGSRLYKFRDDRRILLFKRVIYAGENIIDAAASLDTQTGSPIVSITLDAAGARINQRVTGANVGNRMAVVYLEITSQTKKDADGNVVRDPRGQPLRVSSKIEEVLTAPVVRDQLGKRFQIEGTRQRRRGPRPGVDAALRRAGGAGGNRRGAHRRAEFGPGQHQPGIYFGDGRLPHGADFYAGVLPRIRHNRDRRPDPEPGADGGGVVLLPGHPDAARRRRHRPDRGHGGGRQRADLRAHPRGNAQR